MKTMGQVAKVAGEGDQQREIALGDADSLDDPNRAGGLHEKHSQQGKCIKGGSEAIKLLTYPSVLIFYRLENEAIIDKDKDFTQRQRLIKLDIDRFLLPLVLMLNLLLLSFHLKYLPLDTLLL